MFIYCVTCQCLTPLGMDSEITQATGIHMEIIRADSEQQAIRICQEGLEARFKGEGDARIRGQSVGVLDEAGHIVNYFWGFRSHRI